MSFLPLDGSPAQRAQLVNANPGLYQSYISSPWQVWPAVPIQRVLEPAPPWGGLVESSSGAMLYTRHSPPVAMSMNGLAGLAALPSGAFYGTRAGDGLSWLSGLRGATDQRSDEQKKQITTWTKGILSAAQRLSPSSADYDVANVRAQLDGARQFLMAGARWDDHSWWGGIDTWQENMDRVNQAQNLVKLQQGTVSSSAVNYDGTTRQDSAAAAAASDLAQTVARGQVLSTAGQHYSGLAYRTAGAAGKAVSDVIAGGAKGAVAGALTNPLGVAVGSGTLLALGGLAALAYFGPPAALKKLVSRRKR